MLRSRFGDLDRSSNGFGGEGEWGRLGEENNGMVQECGGECRGKGRGVVLGERGN